MVQNKSGASRIPKWAYAYEIVPPQDRDQLDSIHALLKQERADAQRRARIWSGRMVVDSQVGHILIVSDNQGQTQEINRRIEAELTALRASFSLTEPMLVEDDDDTETPSADDVAPPEAAS